MSRQERHAWFNLGVFALAGLVFALVAPHVGLLRATACFGLVGFCGLGGLFYRGSKLDERESKIRQTAGIWGHGVFWLLFVGGTMLTWGRHQGGTITIPADNLPLLVFGGVTVVVLVESIAMLVLCKRGILHG
jgi:hypothetical protein